MEESSVLLSQWKTSLLSYRPDVAERVSELSAGWIDHQYVTLMSPNQGKQLSVALPSFVG